MASRGKRRAEDSCGELVWAWCQRREVEGGPALPQGELHEVADQGQAEERERVSRGGGRVVKLNTNLL